MLSTLPQEVDLLEEKHNELRHKIILLHEDEICSGRLLITGNITEAAYENLRNLVKQVIVNPVARS